MAADDLRHRRGISSSLAEGSWLPDALRDLYAAQARSFARVGGAAVVAGAVMGKFGEAVRVYDHGVDELNGEYERAARTDFGVDALTGEAAGDVDAQKGYNREVAAAGSALVADLKRRRARLERALDLVADECADSLARGPQEGNLATLAAEGHADPGDVLALSTLTKADLKKVYKLYRDAKNILDSPRALALLREYILSARDVGRATDVVKEAKGGWKHVLRAINRVAGGDEATKAILEAIALQKLSDREYERTFGVPRETAAARNLDEARRAERAAWKAMEKFGRPAGKVAKGLVVVDGVLVVVDTRDLIKNWDELNHVQRGAKTAGILAGLVAAGAGVATVAGGVTAPAWAPPALLAAGVVGGLAAVIDVAAGQDGGVRDRGPYPQPKGEDPRSPEGRAHREWWDRGYG